MILNKNHFDCITKLTGLSRKSSIISEKNTHKKKESENAVLIFFERTPTCRGKSRSKEHFSSRPYYALINRGCEGQARLEQ